MFSLLAVTLVTAGQLTVDANALSLTMSEAHPFPVDVDLITLTLTATHPQEFDAALKTVNDAEDRVSALVKKEEGWGLRALTTQATANAAAGGPVGGTVTRMLELRGPTSARTHALFARLGIVKGVGSLTLSHDVADRKKALSLARRQALETVRAKAEDYASATGRKLGKVTILTENGESFQPPYAGMIFNVTTNLTVKFALE